MTDNAHLEGVRITKDGYLTASILAARTGIQDYHATELGFIEDKVISVYRPEESVFNKQSMASFVGKPITDNHPKDMVNSSNWKDLSKGVIGEEIARDGEAVRVPISLMDQDTIDAVQSGKREVSVGYKANIEFVDGVTPDGQPYQAIQKNIDVNHIAIVGKGRAGEEFRIGDSAVAWGAAPSTHKDNMETDMSDKTRAVVVNDQAFEVNDQGKQAIDILKEDIKSLKDSASKKDVVISDKDNEIGKLKAKVKALEDAAPKAEDLDKMVADRVALTDKARAIIDGYDASGKSDAQIKREVVAQKMGDEAVKGINHDQLHGMFTVITADNAPKSKIQDAINDQKTSVNDAWGSVLKERAE